MQPKTIKIVYWILIILFAGLMLMDGVFGILREKEGREGLAHVGYPIYFMSIMGIAKILGVAALLQTRFYVIKEWAFAGFLFTFIGASMSHYFVGDSIAMILMPVIGVIILFVVYYFWKRFLGLTQNS